MLKFIVVAPPYQERSGGVMVLHELCDALNKNGYSAGIVFYHDGNSEAQNFKFGISNDKAMHKPNASNLIFKDNDEVLEIINKGVVVYPDLITGNPLGAKNVVRYVLNFNENPFFGDFILSYSKVYSQYSDFILFKSFYNELLNDEGARHWDDRDLNLTYFGKGPSYLECKIIPGTILVERDWPRDKEQLSLLLRQCKFFFSYDCVSATNYDALMCGAIPILLHDEQISRSVINKMEVGPFPEVSFNSLDDLPNLISYDFFKVDESMKLFKQNYLRISKSWEQEVSNFVASYIFKRGDD